MRIGVMSDTHGSKWSIKKAADMLKNCDMIIHLGDYVYDVYDIARIYKGKILSVKGNCDFTNGVPGESIEEIEGKKILITHGHNYNVKYGLNELIERGIDIKADLVLYGHTHISSVDYEHGIYFVNPGSTVSPREGFCSIAIIEIENGIVNPSIVRI